MYTKLQRSPRPVRLLIGVLVVVLMAWTVRGQEPTVGVKLKPQVFPVSLSWNSSSGWSVELASALVATPLGTLEVGIGVGQSKQLFPNKRTLAVVVGSKSFLYELSEDHPFQLTVPNNLEGEISLTFDGEDILLRIPHPDRLVPPTYRATEPSVTIAEARIVVTPDDFGLTWSLRENYDRALRQSRENARGRSWLDMMGETVGNVGALISGKPNYGTLKVTSDPSGATIRILGVPGLGGRVLGTTPLTDEVLASISDPYMIRAEKEGCKRSGRDLVVWADEIVELHFVLDCE